MERVLRAWRRIFERGLDTLAATDQKDVLKWWASPKNEAASQRPFELPQNAKSLEKYSAVWERLICYIMRTAPVDWEDETGEWITIKITIKREKALTQAETGVKYSQEQCEAVEQI